MIDDSKFFGLSNWKGRVEVNSAWEGGRNRFEDERNQESHFRKVNLRCLLDTDREMLNR